MPDIDISRGTGVSFGGHFIGRVSRVLPGGRVDVQMTGSPTIIRLPIDRVSGTPVDRVSLAAERAILGYTTGEPDGEPEPEPDAPYNESAPQRAARLQLNLVAPGAADIFVDLDSPEALAEFQRRYKLFRKFHRASVRYTKSKKNRWHAYVVCQDLAPISDLQRIALEAMLGSDPLRALLGLRGVEDGYEYPSVFFEVPGRKKTTRPHTLTPN